VTLNSAIAVGNDLIKMTNRNFTPVHSVVLVLGYGEIKINSYEQFLEANSEQTRSILIFQFQAAFVAHFCGHFLIKLTVELFVKTVEHSQTIGLDWNFVKKEKSFFASFSLIRR